MYWHAFRTCCLLNSHRVRTQMDIMKCVVYVCMLLILFVFHVNENAIYLMEYIRTLIYFRSHKLPHFLVFWIVWSSNHFEIVLCAILLDAPYGNEKIVSQDVWIACQNMTVWIWAYKKTIFPQIDLTKFVCFDLQ